MTQALFSREMKYEKQRLVLMYSKQESFLFTRVKVTVNLHILVCDRGTRSLFHFLVVWPAVGLHTK
jgi:hypothetical protein